MARTPATKTLTHTRIQRAQAVPGKTSYLWDAAIKGFALRITPAGTKTFCLKFVDPHGKQAWMALGPYTGEESLEAARKRAAEFRNQLAEHRDPRVESRKHLEFPTFAEFVADHLAVQKTKLRASSYEATKFYLEDIAVPQFKGLQINEIERVHVENLLDKVASGWRPGMAKGEKPEKPTPTAANRCQAALSKLFTEAERKGKRTQGTNPCKLIEKKPEAKNRERYLSAAELEAIGKALRATLEANAKAKFPDRTVPYAVAAIKLLMLTGARLNEILGLRWSDVKKDRGVIRIERHKTSGKKGAKELPLNSASAAILEELEKMPSRALGGPWIIQGNKHGTHLVNLQCFWNRIRAAVSQDPKAGVSVEDVRIHDLRHTFASVGVSSGLSLPVVGSLLGHSQPAVTARYAHLDVDPRLQASEKISAKIAESLG